MAHSSKRGKRLKLVVEKTLESAESTLKADGITKLFQTLTAGRPQLAEAIEEYLPQLLEQIKAGIFSDFEKLCDELRFDDQFKELECLIDSSDHPRTGSIEEPLNLTKR